MLLRSAALLLLAFAHTLPAQTISFLPPNTAGLDGIRYPIPANALAAGDFNLDGKLDLVNIGPPQSGFGQTALAVSLGNGDGTFQPPALLLASTLSASSPVVADFNNDGKPDIAVLQFQVAATNPGYSLAILLGKGDGTFRPALLTAVPSLPATLLTADLNHDGHPDLVAGTMVFLGNGDGTFRALPTLDGPAALIADFNQDGKPDLLLAPGQLALALGNGDGTFGKDILIPTPFIPGSFAAGDFNNDGRIDLAISPTKPNDCIIDCTLPIVSIAVLKGNGDGTFQAPVLTANSIGPIFAAADINRDGKLDLIVGNSVLAGQGDGTFLFPVFFGLNQIACDPKDPTFNCRVSSDFSAIVADFNNDGLNDIAEAVFYYRIPDQFPSAEIAVLLNDSPGDGFLVTGVSSPSYKWPAAATSQVTAFGINLAPATASASDVTSPPTTLGGIRVHLLDSVRGDQLAPLFYVCPTQINFVVNTTDTFVYISVERVGTPYIPKGMIIPVQTLQPDLYTVSEAIRVTTNGTQVPVQSPIDVTSGAVYLSLFGTGFDSATSAICSVGTATLLPTYFGSQLQIPGLDQINLLLPATLAGSGNVQVLCSFGTATNPVHITIQ